ncbi:hypothetical protein [Nonomuraea sp. KM88]|uniref:hypothetical protein n=1 Tax=Nonomuraea sp. KM88 TaxID=3457427 RepID=UPI003FCD0210
MPKRHWRKLSWTSEPKLVMEARRHYQRLQAEQTATTQASGSLPALQTGFQRSIALKSMPWGMPELAGHLRRFLEDVTEVEHARGRKVLICIDEVDRIGSVEEATRFLSEIKAIFGSVHCYFLVAVADELGASFARQTITGRSHLENAFDEKISLEPMSFELCRLLLQRRVPGFTEPFVWLGLVLSGGLPRELIRVARRLVEINMEFEYALRLPDLTDRLVREELHEALTGTRAQIGRLPATPECGALLDRLHQLSRPLEPDAPLGDLRSSLKELAVLASEQPPVLNPDDLPLRTLVTELSTLAFLGMTVSDAFKDNCFDLMAGQDPAQPAAGPYLELAAARRELSISAGSCRAAVQRIRVGMGLP